MVSDKADLRKFVVPELIFGLGALKLAGTYARNFGARKVLVVTDPGVRKAGWTSEVVATLEAQGLPSVVFDRVTSNPRSEEVMLGAEIYRRENCNMIVAVGGGSPMDCAKGIGIVTSNRRHILSFEGVDRVTVPAPPLVCIPTTGGSSADVSQFAIINDERARNKIAIISKAVVPDLALIDPETLTTMSFELTAFSGFDAVSHGMESYVSLARSPMTDLHAIESLRLMASNLVAALQNPKDVELRRKTMLGSLYAGMAFSNASLGAIHAMSHSLGGLLDIPHGESNALLMEHVAAFNFEEVPERYVQIAEAMGVETKGMSLGEKKAAFLAKLRQLRKDARTDRTLSEYGVSRDLVPELAEKAMKDPCMVTNPRRPTRRDIEVIYEESL